MSTPPAYPTEDKKNPMLVDGGVLESGNESDSIDTIKALVIEGMNKTVDDTSDVADQCIRSST